jgi:hypothetical protein
MEGGSLVDEVGTSGVLSWYSRMWSYVRGSLNVNLRVVCGVCEGSLGVGA